MKRCADALHDAEIKRKIVDGVECGGERFDGLSKVSQVSARIAAADRAAACGIGRVLVFCVLFVLDVEAAFAGEEQRVAGSAGGKNAVHHVDTEAGVLLDLVGIADAHDVTRLVFGQEWENLGNHFESQLARLANAQTADSVADEVHFNEALGALAAEIGVHAALDDGEEGLCAGVQ